jgi:hypothetical protein
MPPSATTFPCCRDHDLFAPVEKYPQCIQRTPGDEAYWFGWDSSFDGEATLLIARLGGEAMVPASIGPRASARLGVPAGC